MFVECLSVRRRTHNSPEEKTNTDLFCTAKAKSCKMGCKNHELLINFEKTATPSNITVLFAWVSVWSGHFPLVKAVVLLVTLFGYRQVVSSCLPKSRHLLAGPLPSPLKCSYYCCQETDVSSHTGKKVCLWLWSYASARYGWVFVCACVGCGWVSESMTWHFLHPVSVADYG